MARLLLLSQEVRLYGFAGSSVHRARQYFAPDTKALYCAANKGIGWDIARILSEQGLRTILTARRGACR